MDLTTSYLGLQLPHPLMPGASPMADELDTVRRLEDAGAVAIVMQSLFEEQLVLEQMATHRYTDGPAETFAEALSYFPNREDYRLGPAEYLEQLAKVKAAVGVPVIASLNGTTTGGWLEHARLMQEAGADALELNVYSVATDLEVSGTEVERRTVEVVKAVRENVNIPVAVKLSPFYSSLPHLAKQLDDAGADGLILFNRFYQPDIDVEQLEVERTLHLSDSRELLLRLTWLAALSGRLRASLAVTGGVHTSLDAIKAVMAGAHAVQMVSALYLRGPEQIRVIRDEMARWLEEHEYESLQQMQGSMSLQRCPDPRSYERANYMHILQNWRA